jgi:hypothetical protein
LATVVVRIVPFNVNATIAGTTPGVPPSRMTTETRSAPPAPTPSARLAARGSAGALARRAEVIDVCVFDAMNRNVSSSGEYVPRIAVERRVLPAGA